MNAEKTFKKNGYEIVENNEFRLVYSCKLNTLDFQNIVFQDSLVLFDDFQYISMEVLSAVNQQCKELGWLS